jgi:deoxyribonuclease-4
MFYIGCHLSCAKGYLPMVKEAEKIGATAFQFFTRNPRGGNAKALDDADLEAFLRKKEELGIGPLVAHAPYTLNGCSADESVRDFAWRTMREDLERLGRIRTVAERNGLIPAEIYYNFHPGSHVKQGTEVGIRLISEMLNGILTPDHTTTVLLETMAGKGSEIGKNFEQIAKILSMIKDNNKIGVCFDTCHVWDSGYDIVNDLDGVLTQFDKIIGLQNLRAVHLNDSLNPCGSHKDRHAKIGEGYIGKEALCRVINHEALFSLPFILETPNDEAGYAREIAMLKEAYKQ